MIRRFLDRLCPFERVESYALMPLVIALFFTTFSFWFGCSCTKWPLVIGLFVVSALLLVRSPKKVLVLWCWYLIAFVLCAFCFSYRGVDLRVYHAPVQLLLNHGWNPVFQSSIEDVTALTNGECMIYHVLFLPHLNHYIASMISQLTGLFLADTYTSFLMLIILFVVAFRFAKLEWSVHWAMAFVFAAFVALPSKFSIVFDSGIDYALYGYIAVAILSYLNWTRTNSYDDFFLMATTLAFAAGMKFTGLLCSGVILLFVFIRHMKCKQVWYAFFATSIFICVVNAAPYLTAWVRYGSPLYPLHTFNPNIDLVNITDDFTANADGLSMGYGLRIVYAWFSKAIAVWLGGVINGNSNYSPEFHVPGGVDGLKSWFYPLMWVSVFALLLAKKSRITIVCIVVFVLSNLAPLKYIGYSRYFTQIWLIPPLALYGLIYSPSRYAQCISKVLRVFVPVTLFLLTLSIFVKSIAHNAWIMALEAARQRAFNEGVSQRVEFVPQKMTFNYFLRERIKLACGRSLSDGSKVSRKIIVDDGIAYPEGIVSTVKDIERDFPRPEHLQQFKQFKWCKLLSNLPHPLWDK